MRLLAALFVAGAVLLAACTSYGPSPAPPAPPAESPAAPEVPATTLPTAGSPAAGGATIRIVALDRDACRSWSPCVLRVKAGTTVTWVNEDSIPHDVHSPPVLANDHGAQHPVEVDSGGLGGIQPGQSFSYTFTKPGRYEFHCALHHPAMHNPGESPVIIVE